MPSALRTACEPFDRAKPPSFTYWHPLFFLVDCFYALVPVRPTQRRPRLPDGVARSMYDLQRVIDLVMENQLALEQLEHGIHTTDPLPSPPPPPPPSNPSVDVRSIKQQHDKAIYQLQQQHDKELEQLHFEHESQLAHLTTEHQTELDQLHLDHEKVHEQLKQQHEKVYQRMAQEHQDAQDQAEDRIRFLEQQLSNESLRKKQLDLLVRENGQEVQRVTTELMQQQEQIEMLTEQLAYRPCVTDVHVQTEALEQEQLREQVAFYKKQVQVRMQQFYEQEKMVSRLQEHVAILHEQLGRKQKAMQQQQQQSREWVSRQASLV